MNHDTCELPAVWRWVECNVGEFFLYSMTDTTTQSIIAQSQYESLNILVLSQYLNGVLYIYIYIYIYNIYIYILGLINTVLRCYVPVYTKKVGIVREAILLFTLYCIVAYIVLYTSCCLHLLLNMFNVLVPFICHLPE